MAKFKKGDLVQIKSGGPTMTVAKVRPPSTSFDDEGAQHYECEWFAGAKVQVAVFDEETLEAAGDGGG